MLQTFLVQKYTFYVQYFDFFGKLAPLRDTRKRSKKQRHKQSSCREDEVADGSDVVDESVVEQTRRSFIRSQKTKARKQKIKRHKRIEARATGKISYKK